MQAVDQVIGIFLQHFAAAMVFAHWLCLLLLVPFVLADEPAETQSFYALDILMILLLVLLLAIVSLLQPCCSSTSAKRRKTVDQQVQCDLGSASTEVAVPGAVYVTTTGSRWHAQADCRHLKCALKASRLTPCHTCSR